MSACAGQEAESSGYIESGDFTVVAYRSATQTLQSAFTTVRDLGSVSYTIFGLRDAIRDGIVAGPRILVSGDPISPTDGHADNRGIKAVGKLEPGMSADVVAMSKSPLDDIHAVMDVGFVMTNGMVVKSFGGAK